MWIPVPHLSPSVCPPIFMRKEAKLLVLGKVKPLSAFHPNEMQERVPHDFTTDARTRQDDD